MKIAIIPGHRPSHRGAFSPFIQKWEYDFNESVAISAVNEINKISKGNGERSAQLILRPNQTIGEHQAINELCQSVKRLKIDFAIELHCNSSDNPQANGSEIWVYEGTTAFNLLLAGMAVKNISLALGTKNRGIKKAKKSDRAYHFLRGVPCPAQLWEPCFFSNRDDSKIILEKREIYIAELIDFVLGLPKKGEKK